jgi:PAS domain S-box-containing protein
MATTMRRFEDLHVPFMVVGADGNVGYANSAAHRMFAYPAGSLLGVGLHELTSEAAWEELCRDPDLNGGRIHRLQSQVVRSDGHIVDVNMTIEPAVSEHGERTAFVVSYEPLPPWKVRRAV